LRGGSPDPPRKGPGRLPERGFQRGPYGPRGIFGLNRDLANATFILTHAVCLAAIAVAGLVWWIGGLENVLAAAQ